MSGGRKRGGRSIRRGQSAGEGARLSNAPATTWATIETNNWAPLLLLPVGVVARADEEGA